MNAPGRPEQIASRVSGARRHIGATLVNSVAALLTALVLVTEYLGVGRQGYSALGGAQADALGATSGVLTAVLGAVLVIGWSRVRNAMSGPRATPVIVYSIVLAHALALPSVARGGAFAGLLVSSMAVAVGGLTMLAIAWRGKGTLVRGMLSVPVISGLMYGAALLIVADTTAKLDNCTNGTGVASFAVAAIVVVVCIGYRWLIARLKAAAAVELSAVFDRLRGLSIILGLSAGWLTYLCWRHVAPTPALCGTLGTPPGGALTDSVKPFLDASAWGTLTDPSALAVVLIGGFLLGMVTLIDTLSAGAALQATEYSQPLRADRELALNGLATLLAGLFGLLPISLSPARTNSMRQLASTHRVPVVLHAVALLGVLLFLMPLVANLPKAALYGSMFIVALDMVDREAVLLTRLAFRRQESQREIGAAVWVFLAVVVTSVSTHNSLIGVILGVVISLGWLLRSPRSAQFTLVGAGSDWSLEITGALLFHNTQRGLDTVSTRFLDQLAAGTLVRIDVSGVERMDHSAMRCIDGFRERLSARGAIIELASGSMPGPIVEFGKSVGDVR